MSTAAEVVDLLRRAGATVATAESLTGGLLSAAIVAVPGASDVMRGGVVAYAPELKSQLLGVDAKLIAERGTVDGQVAMAMARGARARCSATWAIATTGVAGPDPSEGHRPGTVHVAIAGPAGVATRQLDLPGDRDQVRRGTVAAALSDLVARLGEDSTDGER